MKYKSLYKGYDFLKEDDLLTSLLQHRGVEDPDKLLNLDESCVFDGMLMKNMRTGLELLHKHINNKSKIHVQVDSDTDGNTSAASIIQYIKKVDPTTQITYSLHTGKEHGIIMNRLEGFEIDLLIVPDAGTNDVRESKLLKEKGIDILILDHHEIERTNNHAIVINCKDGEYPNGTLSGAGVVYKYCKEYDKAYGYNYADDLLDLVALGNIADSMDLRNPETRYIVLKGINVFGGHNLFLREIVKKNEYQIGDKVNITKIGWNVAPYINATIRSGTDEEKLDTFRALLGEVEEKEYTPRKSKNNPDPIPQKQTLQEFMARVVTNIKARQDNIVKKGVAVINEKITEMGLDDNKLLMVDVTEVLGNTYTGLVANKLATQYKRPVILLRQRDDDTYGGSCRNYRLSPIVDFRAFLQELGTFNQLSGHSNAFGFNIHIDQLVPTRDKSNELLKDMVIEDVYKVDYEIPVGRLKKKHIKQVGEWEDIWGNMLDEPLFAITDIVIPITEIELKGEKKNMIRFVSKDITFIKRFTNEEEYNRMILKQAKGLSKKRIGEVKIDVVGKFKLNSYNDSIYPQIEIVDFNSVENSRFLF
jgi:single-stranded-DNA-specific exonuclease